MNIKFFKKKFNFSISFDSVRCQTEFPYIGFDNPILKPTQTEPNFFLVPFNQLLCFKLKYAHPKAQPPGYSLIGNSLTWYTVAILNTNDIY